MIENHSVKAGWNFDNSYEQLPEIFYSRLSPTPVSSPSIVLLNRLLAEELGLNPDALLQGDGAAVFGGNQIPEGASPLAQAYAGHQFGHFTMLGDGRAILLGEQVTPQGERFDIQLKGSGPTPYSRGGDGRAALGPMLREYIISEAMHALGIPTTRSLAVTATGEPTYREKPLPGAVLTRVAASHLRVGTFQYAAALRDTDKLRSLADYALQRHDPDAETADNRYLGLLQGVIKRQAALIAKWQHVGFIHGVMNTDNMAISGETIDYGPCAFMDAYDPSTVFSSIDRQGRYAYGNQPQMAAWNLARFAEALLPLLHDDEEEAVKLAETALSDFAALYYRSWLGGMRAKLGLFGEEPEDEALVTDLLGMMQRYRADYSNTFRALTAGELDAPTAAGAAAAAEASEAAGVSAIPAELRESEPFRLWLEAWQARRTRQAQSLDESQQLMRSSNPAVIPRNHKVEEALSAAVEEEDFSVLEKLLEALSQPYAHSSGLSDYCAGPDPSAGPYRTFCGT